MLLNEIQAIVFDVDGTLYRQRSLRQRILLELALVSFRHPLSELRTIPILRAYRRAQEIARSRSENLAGREMQLQIACELSRQNPELVRQTVVEWFHKRPLRHLKPRTYPGLVSFLGAAREKGIKLGVVSDYPAADKLEAMGIRDYFDVVLSSQDDHVGKFKPNPAGLLECLRRLDLRPQHSIYVGDRLDTDLPCAANAGTNFVLLGDPAARHDCLAVSGYPQLSQLFGFSPPD